MGRNSKVQPIHNGPEVEFKTLLEHENKSEKCSGEECKKQNVVHSQNVNIGEPFRLSTVKPDAHQIAADVNPLQNRQKALDNILPELIEEAELNRVELIDSVAHKLPENNLQQEDINKLVEAIDFAKNNVVNNQERIDSYISK